MKIKTKKARLIVKAIVCIVLSLAILVPATMFSLAENETTVLTTPKEMSSDTLGYYDFNKGLFTSKNVTGPDENGEYTVTVDTYTSNVTYLSAKTQTVDILVLFDRSGSMTGSRWTDFKDGLTTVLTSLTDDYNVGEADEDGKVNRKVNLAMIGFDGAVYPNVLDYTAVNKGTMDKTPKGLGYKGTIYNLINHELIAPGGATVTGQAFQKAEEKINERKSNGNKQILLFFTDGVPAIMTSPDNTNDTCFPLNTEPNWAIAAANRLKAAGVDIYTIGCGDGFDEDFTMSSAENGLAQWVTSGVTYYKNLIKKNTGTKIRPREIGVFMNMLSSGWIANKDKEEKDYDWMTYDKEEAAEIYNDYPGNDNRSRRADRYKQWPKRSDGWQNIPDDYTLNPKVSSNSMQYFFSASDGDKLTSKLGSAFISSLATTVVSQGSLLGDYSVKDTVSNYFEIVPNSAEFYRIAYMGGYNNNSVAENNYGESNREWSETKTKLDDIEYKINDNKSIEVLATKENREVIDACVIDNVADSSNEKHEGNKLRITYKIRPKDSFMGGSSVPTHDYFNSGIYKGNEVVQSFDKANSAETNPVPTTSVELVRPTEITANSNAKIGFLYPDKNVGNKNVNVTYQGRYADDNGKFNSYTMNADSGMVYDKNGSEITYGSYEVESDTGDDTVKDTGTKTTYFILPSEYVCLMYGNAFQTDDSVGVVENSGYIQFNSTGISLNGTKYSSKDVTVDKTYYLAWSGYDANEIVQRFEEYIKNGNKDNEAMSDKGITRYTDANGNLVGNPILFRDGFRSVEQIVGTVEIDVHVPTVTVNDAVYTTAVSDGYKYSSNELAAALDVYYAGAQAEDKQAIIDYITTGALKNFVPTTINTTEFKLPMIEGGKIVYKLTTSDEFITPIEEFNKDVYVVSYVKGYAKDDATNTEIADKDKLQIALEYVNAKGQRIVNAATENLLDFRYTFDAFEAINQCSYCANGYTPQFLGYSAQVHKEAVAQKRFITVRKDGAHDDTDSFIFGVYGYDKATDGSVNIQSRKLLGTFVVHGNNTQTVSVSKAECSYFSVEENLSGKFNNGWSWNYNDVNVSFDGSAQSNTATDKGFPIFSFADNNSGANVMLTFKNTYDTSTEKIASDSTWCINIIKSDSITRMTEDGTETFAKQVMENTEATTVAE